jgi:hypothetical protein
MTDFRHSYGTRYVEIDGRSTPVFTQVVHREDCRYGKSASRLHQGEIAEIRAKGFDTIIFNAGHNPQRSVWRTGKCCHVTLDDLAQV